MTITYNFKVDNPNLSNEIVQMRSEHLQPPIYSQTTKYYLDKQPIETKFKSTKIKVANLRK